MKDYAGEAHTVKTTITASTDEAAQYIRDGHLTVFPTETVYGLGADALNADAVKEIFRAKSRPSDNPLIVHVADREGVEAVARSITPAADALLEAFAPGPITLVLPVAERVPRDVTAGLDTVGVRIPSLPLAQEFLQACDTPVAAPSANRSGRPSPTTWRAAYEDLVGRVPCILRGGRTDAGIESTVVDVTSDVPTVLRPGAVSLERLREVVPNIEMVADDSDVPKSPGTKHRHYAPDAKVIIVDDPGEADAGAVHGYIGVDKPAVPAAFAKVYVAPSVEAYGRELFHFLRECDGLGCRAVFAQSVPENGLGRAVMDRLRRAASR
ncbi:threonylcarbamoyl-AMP synthase [Longibacter salinarum]|uniref:Threonylcarbamoyl-AMP synthase n=1 Tax=Longibacter salinarum TaxID=1850348 RepID=A0A2A8D1N2_9BACT|nr:L-threonylcarbamoyladenylate synthase [Longibacter salinarum]PEN14790.1 threonylcarbamoyl-AMP synthase [Longibacter salinarum]